MAVARAVGAAEEVDDPVVDELERGLQPVAWRVGEERVEEHPQPARVPADALARVAADVRGVAPPPRARRAFGVLRCRINKRTPV